MKDQSCHRCGQQCDGWDHRQDNYCCQDCLAVLNEEYDRRDAARLAAAAKLTRQVDAETVATATVRLSRMSDTDPRYTATLTITFGGRHASEEEEEFRDRDAALQWCHSRLCEARRPDGWQLVIGPSGALSPATDAEVEACHAVSMLPQDVGFDAKAIALTSDKWEVRLDYMHGDEVRRVYASVWDCATLLAGSGYAVTVDGYAWSSTKLADDGYIPRAAWPVIPHTFAGVFFGYDRRSAAAARAAQLASGCCDADLPRELRRRGIVRTPKVGEQWGCGSEAGVIERFTADSRAVIRQTKPGGLVEIGQTFELPIHVLTPAD